MRTLGLLLMISYIFSLSCGSDFDPSKVSLPFTFDWYFDVFTALALLGLMMLMVLGEVVKHKFSDGLAEFWCTMVVWLRSTSFTRQLKILID